MFKFFRSPIPSLRPTLLALDVGTEFVKALIAEPGDKNPRIIGVGKTRQKMGEMQSGAVTDIAAVIEHCKAAMADAERMAGRTPNQLVLGIAGELVKGATRTIRYRRHDPEVKIHYEELKNIVHKIQWKAFEQMRGELAYETGYNEIDIKLVSAAIVDVKIDDYKVVNPIGFQGREVVMTVFNAFSPLTHYGVLQTIAAELGVPLLAITSEPYALARALEGGDPNTIERDAIFVDVGGGTTDLAVIQDQALAGTKMFTLGGRTFTKRLSNNLNVSFPEAEEIKLAYSGNRLEKQSHKIVQNALRGDTDIWLTGIRLTLQEFTSLKTLPPKLLLSGGGSLLPEIKLVLTEGDWWKDLPFDHKPAIRFLHPQDLPNIKDQTNLLHDPQDITPMALAKRGIDLMNEEKILTKILRKVVRLIQA